MNRRASLLLLVAAVTAVAACGGDDDNTAATIEVDAVVAISASGGLIEPAEFTVPADKVVRLEFTNNDESALYTLRAPTVQMEIQGESHGGGRRPLEVQADPGSTGSVTFKTSTTGRHLVIGYDRGEEVEGMVGTAVVE